MCVAFWACVLDFEGSWDQHLSLIEFAYNNSYQSTIQMAPYKALYGRKCRSLIGWFKVGDHPLLGPNMILDAVRKIQLVRDRMRAAQSWQKSYVDNRCRELEFDVGDHVFLKISLFKGVMRFGQRGKLSPRYIGPFEILRRWRSIAYELALPPELSGVHPVFHESMLRKHLSDQSNVLQP